MSNAISMVGTSWCSYTNKMLSDVEGDINFNVVLCDKEDNALCELTSSYPTFYANNEQCHGGYADKSNILEKCKLR